MVNEDAIDHLLAREPGNIAALVRKGDCRAEAGDDRSAAAFYKRALALAGAGPIPSSLRPFVERASAGISRSTVRFEDFLEESLSKQGFDFRNRPRRFQHSLDLMLGRRQVELKLQRPTGYFFPDLAQRRYFDASEFPWAGAVQAQAGDFLSELRAYQSGSGDGFTPYLVSDPLRPPSNFHGLADNPAWSTFYIWQKGAPVASLTDSFPRTFKALRPIDLPHITVRAPSILFSRLAAGARIPAHHGMLNVRLICHLPLLVPPGCGFRVGGESRLWKEGELLVFDDTVEHEAWNNSASERILLIFDVWRPELDEAERAAIAAMFEAVDSYSQARA